MIQLQEQKSDYPLLSPLLTTSLINSSCLVETQSLPNITESPQKPVFLKSASYDPSIELTVEMNNITELLPYQNLRLKQRIARCNNHSIVDLRGRQLNNQDTDIVVKYAMKEKQCKELELGLNDISFDGIWTLSSELNNNITLIYLPFWNNSLSDDSVSCLLGVLSMNNNALRVLNLGKNRITDISVEGLASLLRTNRILTELYLGKNQISDNGVRMLAASIENHNQTLQTLFLCLNPLITDECVKYLLPMILHNNKLKELSVNDCSLSKESKEELQMIARQKKFQVGIA